MKRLERVVVDYLTKYGQPQSVDAIVQAADEADELCDREALEAMADDKLIRRVEGGVDSRGESVTLYAPL